MTLSITTLFHCVECHCAECRNLFIVMPNVIMLSDVMMSVVCADCIYTDCRYADCIYTYCRYADSICWMSLCWMSLCWMSLCWMSLCWMSLCWMSWRLLSLFASPNSNISAVNFDFDILSLEGKGTWLSYLFNIGLSSVRFPLTGDARNRSKIYDLRDILNFPPNFVSAKNTYLSLPGGSFTRAIWECDFLQKISL